MLPGPLLHTGVGGERKEHGRLGCEPFHSQCLKHFIEAWLRRRHSPLRWQGPPGARGTERTMKSTILAVAVATAALNIFAPAVGHARTTSSTGTRLRRRRRSSWRPTAPRRASGRSMDMASHELPMSIQHRQSLRPPAASAGMFSMCSFAIDLTQQASCYTGVSPKRLRALRVTLKVVRKALLEKAVCSPPLPPS